MGETMIFSKEQFMKTLDKSIADDDVIVLTTIVEQMQVIPKKNKMRVEHAYAANTFKNPGSVNDIMNLLKGAFVVGKKNMVNNELEKQFEEEVKSKKKNLAD